MQISANVIYEVISALVLIGGAFIVIKSRIPQQTIGNLQQLAEAYEKRIKALEDDLKNSHEIQLENMKSIADLQGQVKVYKELPLQELASGIREVVRVTKATADNNREILATLQATAKINAEDRSILTNQNQHIKTEVHKIINRDIKAEP